MHFVRSLINIRFSYRDKNFDASALKFNDYNGVCVISDGSRSKGIMSDRWAKHLCDITGFNPLSSINGLKMFVDNIWEEFYEDTVNSINDAFTLKAFEDRGSCATYTACWFRQEGGKIFYNWISYGNSAVLIYDENNDELLVPGYGEGLLGFLSNKGQINWKEDDLTESCFVSGKEGELKPGTKVIVASDVMAEHLALSYLIIKSKDDKYWEQLSQLMRSDSKLEELLFNNRDAYQYTSFNDLIVQWQNVSENKGLRDFVAELQNENKIAKDDITLQVISYDASSENFTTTHSPVVIKSSNQKKYSNLLKVKPVQKHRGEEFKTRKEEYINVLLDNRVTKLYHFTDHSNIEMIKKM
jgi:hypothetical protein